MVRRINTEGESLAQAPQEGLVPLFGSDFYATPDEPVDPWDCNRYPDSAYCGGNPFTSVPIGIDPDLVVDNCNIGISLTPTLGFVRLPTTQIVYRFPDCKKKEPPPPPESLGSPPLTTFPNCQSGKIVNMVIARTSYRKEWTVALGPRRTELNGALAVSVGKCEIQSITFPGIAKNSSNVTAKFSVRSRIFTQTDWTYKFRRFSLHFSQALALATADTVITPAKPIFTDTHWFTRNVSSTTNSTGSAVILFSGTIEEAKAAYGVGKYTFFDDYSGPYDNYHIYTIDSVQYEVVWSNCPKQDDLADPPPPPPPKKKKCPPMSCCCEPTNNSPDSDLLLKQILEKLNGLDKKIGTFPRKVDVFDSDETVLNRQAKTLDVGSVGDALTLTTQRIEIANKLIGIEEYPASLPASFISKDEGWLGNLIPNSNIKIANLTKLLEWYIKRFDEVIGQFEVPIEIKDSDPSKPGDQPQGLKIPNIAEGIGEIMQLLLQISINSESANTLLIKNLVESAATKQQGLTAYSYIKAVADYMNFNKEETTTKMQLSFTPGSDSFEDFLKESKAEVEIIELGDDEKDYKSVLAALLHAAAIIEAVFFKKFDKGDIEKQLTNYIKDKAKAYEEVDKESNESKSNWNQFLENCELGFTGSSGISNATDPYGCAFEERPKIKEIGMDESK